MSLYHDNPFGGVAGARPETWAYGFRNPWRMWIDPETSGVWVANNGQDLWEQIYLVERGANYGWSVYEGGRVFNANRQLGPTPVSKPLFDHPRSEAGDHRRRRLSRRPPARAACGHPLRRLRDRQNPGREDRRRPGRLAQRDRGLLARHSTRHLHPDRQAVDMLREWIARPEPPAAPPAETATKTP